MEVQLDDKTVVCGEAHSRRRLELGGLRIDKAPAKKVKSSPPLRGPSVSAMSLPALYLHCGGTNIRLPASCLRGHSGGLSVIGKPYFVRQAATLLRFAQSTHDPKVAAALVEKAADLKSQMDAGLSPDVTPLAPDVQRPT
jgi:hypothetical protein